MVAQTVSSSRGRMPRSAGTLQPASFDPVALTGRAGSGLRSRPRFAKRPRPPAGPAVVLYFVTRSPWTPATAPGSPRSSQRSGSKTTSSDPITGLASPGASRRWTASDPKGGSPLPRARATPALRPGPLPPEGPRNATRTPTRPSATLARAGASKPAKRELQRHFKPGWIALD